VRAAPLLPASTAELLVIFLLKISTFQTLVYKVAGFPSILSAQSLSVSDGSLMWCGASFVLVVRL
jgi:hypothetical protein